MMIGQVDIHDQGGGMPDLNAVSESHVMCWLVDVLLQLTCLEWHVFV